MRRSDDRHSLPRLLCNGHQLSLAGQNYTSADCCSPLHSKARTRKVSTAGGNGSRISGLDQKKRHRSVATEPNNPEPECREMDSRMQVQRDASRTGRARRIAGSE